MSFLLELCITSVPLRKFCIRFSWVSSGDSGPDELDPREYQKTSASGKDWTLHVSRIVNVSVSTFSVEQLVVLFSQNDFISGASVRDNRIQNCNMKKEGREEGRREGGRKEGRKAGGRKEGRRGGGRKGRRKGGGRKEGGRKGRRKERREEEREGRRGGGRKGGKTKKNVWLLEEQPIQSAYPTICLHLSVLLTDLLTV